MEQPARKTHLMLLPDLQFNELSCTPLATDAVGAHQRVQSLIATFKTIAQKGVRGIRCPLSIDQIRLTEHETLNDFFNNPHNRLFINYLRPLLRYPFIDDETDAERDYSAWTFSTLVDGTPCAASGLAAAHLTDSLAIGFCSCYFWRKNYRHSLSINKGTCVKTVTVICLSTPTHIKTQEVADWITRYTPDSPLLPCHVSPDQKPIKLRDDHGQDILLALAKKLTHSPYVTKVINSLPFNPSARTRIEYCHSDGKIELRIPEDDRGLGLIVQTTGRTLRETERIAETLKDL
jgi:hypothetical protein